VLVGSRHDLIGSWDPHRHLENGFCYLSAYIDGPISLFLTSLFVRFITKVFGILLLPNCYLILYHSLLTFIQRFQ